MNTNFYFDDAANAFQKDSFFAKRECLINFQPDAIYWIAENRAIVAESIAWMSHIKISIPPAITSTLAV